MKVLSLILVTLAVIAITTDFRVDGSPRPKRGDDYDDDDDDNDDSTYVIVDGFAFDGPVGSRPSSTRRPQIARTTRPTVGQTVRPTVGRTVQPTVQPTAAPNIASTAAPASTTQNPVVAQCTQNCRVTSEYNPVCGTDRNVYTNPGMLNCAKNCGQNVEHSHFGPCTSNVRG